MTRASGDGFITPVKAKDRGIPEIIPDMKAGKRIYEKWLGRQEETQ